MKKTINELLVLSKTIRERLNSLKSLNESLTKRESFFGSPEKVVEPTYDVRKVDQKIIELQTFLFHVDAAIKKSNAVTEIEIEYNLGELLKPLE